MARKVLLGDEAVAMAAVHSGITGAYSYPGTPATEIMETIQKLAKRVTTHKIHAHWTANEKTAYEAALGHCYAGRRSIVSFKHVGLNVAMDPYMSSAITGANGGMVVAVADDPGMHSSQSEQDSRFMAHFAQVPCLDPWDQQTAYDWTRNAFDLSEEFNIPVMLRLVTRLAHSRCSIEVGEPLAEVPTRPVCKDWREWTLLPSNAKPNYERLVAKQSPITDKLAKGPYFEMDETGRRTYGVITTGLARNYVKEAYIKYDIRYPLLAVGAYPIPDKLLHEMFRMCDCVLLVEEGMPFVERVLHAAGLTDRETLQGRLTGALPLSGELNPEIVARALGVNVEEGIDLHAGQRSIPLVARPPQLCQGCSHIDVFSALDNVLSNNGDGRVFGDIGCYALGSLPPYDTMHTCVDMGASIPMAVGASQAGLHPAIAVIGDSTFTHSGMTGLIDAVQLNANVIVIISDNSTVAMTGGQPDIATGEDLIKIVTGLGVDPEHIHHIDANKAHQQEIIDTVKKEMDFAGPSVLVCSRACIHNARREKAEEAENAAIAEELKAGIVTGEGGPVVTQGYAEDGGQGYHGRDVCATEVLSRDIVLCGVGGQGILAIAQAVSITATRLNLYVKQSETHGMSQRGGAVISHMRYSDKPVFSDLIQSGNADLIISVEPMESLRWISYLSTTGHLVANVKPVENIPNYPELSEILGTINQLPGYTLLDADRVASMAGSVRAANMVLLGAAAEMLGFADEQWEHTLTEIWKKKGERTVAINLKAFEYGRDAGKLFRALTKAGMNTLDALLVASYTLPSAEGVNYADQWIEILNGDKADDLRSYIRSSGKPLPVNPDEIPELMEQAK